MNASFLKSLLAGAALLMALALPAADFPEIYNTEPDTNAAPPSPSESLAAMQLPPGFKATIFAAEPDVRQPIAMAWDARGRLWIAENYTYAETPRKYDMHLRDRLLIFEDKKGDGHFSSRKVFTDDVQMLMGVEIGNGGVWVMCPPQLMFIPDKNGDDIPDGAAEVVLDGFTTPPENHHTIANGLHWGPDGWLYGRCGASSVGEVGAPGTPAAQRVPLRGGIWRYHPQRKVFETLTYGTTNPWGNDWDAHGEQFFVNTVIGHLWHMIPGAHFQRPHTIDPNPHTYDLIDMHADHWHWDNSRDWSDSRTTTGLNDERGGGHAHCGAMIYLADNWPAEYRGHLFTLNLHGHRVNQDILERSGSGYVGHHGQDIFKTGDSWFRGLDLSYGPDGGVFMLDWSDTGECHEHSGIHRTSGRIYKITYGDAKPAAIGDLSKLSNTELVNLQLHPNEWFVRRARRELAYRAEAGKAMTDAREQLEKMFARDLDPIHKLRALWSLYVMGAANDEFLATQLRHPDEHVRTWAIRLLCDFRRLDGVDGPLVAGGNKAVPTAMLAEFARMAKTDSSGLVRLALASTLQRLSLAQRAELAAPLLAHAEDANDHNLPLLIWYGLMPVGDSDPAALGRLVANCELPVTRQYIARRLGEEIEKSPAAINAVLKVAAGKSAAFQADILAGLSEALTGWHKANKPAAWDALQGKLAGAADAKLKARVRDLSALFGDGRALDEVKRIALDKNADLNVRKTALQTLIAGKPPELRQICEQLLSVRFLNAVAVRGLAQFDDPAIGEKLARSYRNFHPTERAPVMDTLVSRPIFAKALLTEMAAGRIPRAELTPFHARQIRSFKDPELTKKLAEAWGELRDTADDKKQFMAKLKTQLTPEVLARADKAQGRVMFNTACANCHTLYGHGGQVGPDLTGSGRDNLDYILENVVDPSAVVGADFRMVVANLKDGRVINGIISAKTDRTITLKTMTEVTTLERSQIEKLEESTLSIMPEGLLEGMNETQLRNFIAYLMNKSQVPLPDGGGSQ